MTTYAERDATLLVLGFKSYRDYLDSGIWKSIRNAVLTRSDGICSVCGSLSANQVHHRDYSETTLMGRNLSSLIPICSVCHHAAERDGKGRKQSLSVANRTINVLSETPKNPRRLCFTCRKNPTRKNKQLCGRCSRSAMQKHSEPSR